MTQAAIAEAWKRRRANIRRAASFAVLPALQRHLQSVKGAQASAKTLTDPVRHWQRPSRRVRAAVFAGICARLSVRLPFYREGGWGNSVLGWGVPYARAPSFTRSV